MAMGQGSVSQVSIAEDTLVITIQFPEPDLISVSSEGSPEKGQKALPRLSQNLIFLSRGFDLQVHIQSLEEESIGTDATVIPVEDVSIGDKNTTTAYDGMQMSHDRIWEMETLGTVRDTMVNVLRI